MPLTKRKFLKKETLFKAADLAKKNISSAQIKQLIKSGQLNRIGYGLYETDNRSPQAFSTLVEVCKRIPRGVMCLLTALNYYELTTFVSPDIWIALQQGSWKPIERMLPIKVTRFSKKVFESGIIHFKIEGIPVQMYSAAKTVADCFKYRAQIGMDIAIEGLREGVRKRVFSVPELMRYATICRVSSIITPYIEAFTI